MAKRRKHADVMRKAAFTNQDLSFSFGANAGSGKKSSGKKSGGKKKPAGGGSVQ